MSAGRLERRLEMASGGSCIACLRIRRVCAWPAVVLLAAAVLWLALVGPGPIPIVHGASRPGVLVLSDQARRVLELQYRPSRTELMGCMIGEIRGDTVSVERVAPADVDPRRSAPTWVLPRQTCEEAGWAGTIGTIHTHPAAERCWYFFPGTQVPTSDGQSFLNGRYAVDAILCGDRVVWIGRQKLQKHLQLGAARSAPRP